MLPVLKHSAVSPEKQGLMLSCRRTSRPCAESRHRAKEGL